MSTLLRANVEGGSRDVDGIFWPRHYVDVGVLR